MFTGSLCYNRVISEDHGGVAVAEAAAPVITQEAVMQESTPVALRPRLEATWAVFCGALASGALAPEVSAVVRLLAGWLLADIILGFALAQLLATVRAIVQVGPPPDCAGRPTPSLPYAEPGSPGDRLARSVARWVDHWHARLRPAIGHHVASFITASATALLVGAYLGQSALVASAAAIVAAGGVALACGRRVDALARWHAGIALAVAWYLGHRLFAVVSPASWGAAALVGLAAFGRVAYSDALAAAERRTQGGRRLVGIVWSVLVGAMLAARQPVAAGITAIAGLAESMTLGASTLRPGRVGWLAAMLLVALIVARAG